jgi:cytochrome c oxidase subunit 2
MVMTEPVTSAKDSQRVDIKQIFWIWLGLTVLLVLFSLWVPARLMGPPASPTMRDVEQTMTVFSLAASPVAALVWAVGGYSLLRWRNRSRLQPTEDGPPLRGNGMVTLTWSIVSTVLCVFLLIWGLAEMTTVTSAAQQPSALVVNVTGQQWLWTFSYPGQGDVESDQLYLPLDRPVVFHVTSKDVIHSFWVVQMGIKVDANPGVTTKTSVTPNKLGIFDVRCAELCGLRHADMETTARVVSPADFSAWITQNGGHS